MRPRPIGAGQQSDRPPRNGQRRDRQPAELSGGPRSPCSRATRKPGGTALAAALTYQKGASKRLFQIGLADALLSQRRRDRADRRPAVYRRAPRADAHGLDGRSAGYAGRRLSRRIRCPRALVRAGPGRKEQDKALEHRRPDSPAPVLCDAAARRPAARAAVGAGSAAEVAQRKRPSCSGRSCW